MSTPLDILEALDINTRQDDPRYKLAEQDDIVRTSPRLSSIEHMQKVFETVMKQRIPPKDEIERMSNNGFHFTAKGEKVKGHRYEIEQGCFEVENFTGVVPENQFAWMCAFLTDAGNQSSFIHGLQKQRQPNGDWVIVGVKTGESREKRMNGRRPVEPMRISGFPRSQEDPNEQIVDWLTKSPEEVFEVGVRMMSYAIMWIDTRNAERMPDLDATGKPIASSVANVRVESDPALAAAIDRLASVASGVGGAGPVAPVVSDREKALNEEIEKLRAQLAGKGKKD